MAGYTAADVKKLRDETDAPMMECKAALEEAGGDIERAKEVLREKGKAAAGKKAGRATNAGVVAFSVSADGLTLGAVVVQSETDFVSKNEGFVTSAQEIADYVRDNGAPEGNPMDDPKFKAFAEEIVAKFRENVEVTKAMQFKTSAPASVYLHHDRTAGTVIVAEGPGAGSEELRKVAVHATAFPPEVVAKEELSQEKLASELEIELKRAMEEGKPENIARNIAQGRVNKDFVKRVALLEQPWYLDPAKSVSQYLAESAKGTTVTQAVRFAVGG